MPAPAQATYTTAAVSLSACSTTGDCVTVGGGGVGSGYAGLTSATLSIAAIRMHSALRERMQFYLYSYKEPVRFPRNAINAYSVRRSPYRRRGRASSIHRSTLRRQRAIVDGRDAGKTSRRPLRIPLVA